MLDSRFRLVCKYPVTVSGIPSRAECIRHIELPVEVDIFNTEPEYVWFFVRDKRSTEIDALYKRSPKSVSDEELNLLILSLI